MVSQNLKVSNYCVLGMNDKGEDISYIDSIFQGFIESKEECLECKK